MQVQIKSFLIDSTYFFELKNFTVHFLVLLHAERKMGGRNGRFQFIVTDVSVEIRYSWAYV